MEEIIVKNQQDFDSIPDDYSGLIKIDSPRGNWITVNKKKGYCIVLRGNSSAVLRGNSSAVLRENSSAELRGNSSAVLWENSSAELRGNSQVVKMSPICKIELHGNARIVEMPKELLAFMDFYGVKHDGINATMYKAVRADLKSFYDISFQYEVGKTHTNECDTDTSETCGMGLHIAYKEWSVNYGKGESFKDFKVIECSVPIDKIVYCPQSDGKVRTSVLTVIREVPIEEWGVMGKIIAKQRARNTKE
jgi:hypothetical protein